MLNEHDVCGGDHSSEPVDPRQFGLIDLFAIMTSAALVSAMIAPFLREMQTENRNRLFSVAIFQLVVTVGAFA